MKKASQILFLSYDGLTDPLGQSQILPYMVGLAARGYEISIVSFEKINRFREQSHVISGICEKAGIHWHPMRYRKSPPVLSTFFNVLALERKVLALNRERQFDIVHCRSYITPLSGFILQKRFGVKMLFDMRGFWADERVEGGLWKLSNPVYKLIFNFFKRKEKEFLSQADAIVSLTHAAKAYIISNFKIQENKISVIPCSVDLSLFDPSRYPAASRERLKKNLGIPQDSFVLLYLGSLGTWYMNQEMLDFFKTFRIHHPKAIFLIVTQDNNLMRSENGIFVTSAKRTEVPLYCSIANASIFFIRPGFSKKASSATKMGEVMAMGVPVITNKGWGDIEFFMNYTDSIMLYDVTGPEQLQRMFDPNPIREFARNYLSLDAALDAYDFIYRKLTNASE
jgi:glycosyltransferase involved in cell wall biosynthesis